MPCTNLGRLLAAAATYFSNLLQAFQVLELEVLRPQVWAAHALLHLQPVGILVLILQILLSLRVSMSEVNTRRYDEFIHWAFVQKLHLQILPNDEEHREGFDTSQTFASVTRTRTSMQQRPSLMNLQRLLSAYWQAVSKMVLQELLPVREAHFLVPNSYQELWPLLFDCLVWWP